MVEKYKVKIRINQDEDGIYIVECIDLPGCISQGKTIEEAIENIKDAIKAYIDSLKKHNEPIPFQQEKVIEVYA